MIIILNGINYTVYTGLCYIGLVKNSMIEVDDRAWYHFNWLDKLKFSC